VPAALPDPEQTEAASVPSDDGARRHDVKCGPPTVPDTREPRPQQPVRARRTGRRAGRERCSTALTTPIPLLRHPVRALRRPGGEHLKVRAYEGCAAHVLQLSS
jgi:hypothetical protein